MMLLACAVPADLYRASECHGEALWPDVRAEIECDGLGHEFAWTGATRLGGLRGDAWEGLGFWIGGDTEGGSVSVGVRPEGAPARIGFEAVEGEEFARFGYVPATTDAPAAPFVEVPGCDASGTGSVRLSGLPEALGGELYWEFAAGEGGEAELPAWEVDLPAECAIDPGAWQAVRIEGRCGDALGFSASFVGPRSYAVTLDRFGVPVSMEARWDAALSGTCGGNGVDAVEAELTGEIGSRTFTTSVATLREGWIVDSTPCGECENWEVIVDGIPGR